MARAPLNTDFFVEVEGIGNFTFARRTMRDELRIGAEFSRYTEGLTAVTPWLDAVAGWISTLVVLTVRAPEGWNIEGMDPLDDDSYDKLKKVHDALRAKEDDFRRKKSAAVQTAGSGVGADVAVLVPTQVQPTAD